MAHTGIYPATVALLAACSNQRSWSEGTFPTTQNHYYRTLNNCICYAVPVVLYGMSCNVKGKGVWWHHCRLAFLLIQPIDQNTVSNQDNLVWQQFHSHQPHHCYFLSWKSSGCLIKLTSTHSIGDLSISFQTVFHRVSAKLKEVLRNKLEGKQERMETVFPQEDRREHEPYAF